MVEVPDESMYGFTAADFLNPDIDGNVYGSSHYLCEVVSKKGTSSDEKCRAYVHFLKIISSTVYG